MSGEPLRVAQREETDANRPVVLRIPADLTTPVRAFLTLTAPLEDAFLLESVAGGESQARYSFLGFAPSERLEAGVRVRTHSPAGTEERRSSASEALAEWAGARQSPSEKPPVPFLGSSVGWMDFSSFALFEPALQRAFPFARDSRLVFGLFTTGLVLDHLKQEGYLYSLPQEGESDRDCRDRLRVLEKRLAGPAAERSPVQPWRPSRTPDRRRFERNVASAQDAITDGEAYQIVISEPFEGSFHGDPFTVYRRLRRLNPSPYHFYVSLGGRQVVGASPEMLVRVEGDQATTVPIAGTRRRGATPEEDRALEEELLRDPKELAEHAMLVDLARNDLGRVCEHGSVTVPVRGSVERFSHVMHITSEVRGRVAAGTSPVEALISTFPAGTVSGAPKIRATEILSELEGEDRGLYGGAVGILDPAGNLEVCIAIRSAEFDSGTVRFRSGAGIVVDSRAKEEWDEIHHKAGALLEALGGKS